MDNKRLVERVAANLGRSTDDVSKLLEALTGVLQARCSEMRSVAIPSFGTFDPLMHSERVETDAASGKRMLLPPKVELQFKVSRVFKNKLK